jgi:hypothetical protein
VTGLLIAGDLIAVPGLTVIPPASHGGPAWAALDPGDYRARLTPWIRQIILHTTGGNWPQPIRAGAGPRGHAEQIARMWVGDPAHSAAHLLVDYDGAVACLCDLARVEAWHAEASNPWSVGIEMCTLPDGGIYEATLAAAATLVAALCEHFGIPEQMPRGPYRGQPLRRMETGAGATRRQLGGPDIVGVLGHRDNTGDRGRGDPGDAIWARLAALGFEGLDYDGLEDVELGKRRQAALVARGEQLAVDGIVGPASLAAARRQGFALWRDVA